MHLTLSPTKRARWKEIEYECARNGHTCVIHMLLHLKKLISAKRGKILFLNFTWQILTPRKNTLSSGIKNLLCNQCCDKYRGRVRGREPRHTVFNKKPHTTNVSFAFLFRGGGGRGGDAAISYSNTFQSYSKYLHLGEEVELGVPAAWVAAIAPSGRPLAALTPRLEPAQLGAVHFLGVRNQHKIHNITFLMESFFV